MNATLKGTTATLALAVASMMCNAPLRAQVTEVARTPIADAAQITFGYLCDDRFVVRNDGTRPVDLEYALEKGNEHTKLALNARESVELASKSKASMELWKDGKLIARAEKEKRSCKDVQGNGSVTVTPLEVSAKSNSRYDIGYGGYPYYDPFGFGMYYGYGYGFGLRSYPSIVRYPVIVGGGRIGGGGGRRGGR